MWRDKISRFLAPSSRLKGFTLDGIRKRLSLTKLKRVGKMIGHPNVVVESHLVTPACTCHEERSRCSDCAEKLAESRALPISHLIRGSQVDFVTRSKLLVVEGNIGVGKTTLAKKLANALEYKLCLEPTTENPFLGEKITPCSIVLSRRYLFFIGTYWLD